MGTGKRIRLYRKTEEEGEEDKGREREEIKDEGRRKDKEREKSKIEKRAAESIGSK
jgi:hypothetical protein